MDRTIEADALGRLLAGVRDGLSGVLVLRGEAGVGKTALLDWAAGQAPDMQVAQATGVDSEMDLGFAGLHLMLIRFLDGLQQLPAPQRRALEAAFGLVAGPEPDRFLVGLAALALITEAAAERPVLCLVDDAQWLDRVSVEVLGFVARRLHADRVGMVFAVRTGERQPAALEGLPELAIAGLPAAAAAELLAAVVGGTVDPLVAERIVAETAGNPLALVELAGELSAEELSGVAPLRGPLRSEGRMEELYLSRVRAMPGPAQLLLLVAAADELGDPVKVWQAAGQLGIDPEVAELPAVEQLVTFAPRVRFRHPLMRSAAYHAAPVTARQRAHQALAAASDPERDPDRRAWHLAQAAPGPDEQVAAELERSAGRARARGGWASSAAFLERAAELTPDAERRAQRLLAAAEARLDSGEALAARALVERAASDLADPLAMAKARRLEGLTLSALQDLPAASSALLEAAQIVAPRDPRLARDTLLEALLMTQLAGQFGAATAEVVRAVRSAPQAGDGEQAVTDLLLEGFAAMAERRYSDGAPLLHQAMATLADSQPLPDQPLQRFLAMSMAASLMYDDSAWPEWEHHWVTELRDRGALAALLAVLISLAYSQVMEGRSADAEATAAEGRSLSEATGYRAYLALFECAELAVLSRRGREQQARVLAGRLRRSFAEQGFGRGISLVDEVLTDLEIGLGNYAEALRTALEASSEQSVGQRQVAELVEAGIRSGDRDTAAAALAAFAPLALASGTHWALGLLARCRALLAADDAEPQYRLSIEHLRQSRIVPELARSHLVYGEWLRRRRRRRDARDQLRAALSLFDAMGMGAFADRARSELRATGEHAAQRGPRATDDALTPQEAQIARLAAEGATNPEIAARLFLSAATVEYHLRKVFRKLDITGRAQLARALADQDGDDAGPAA